MALINLMRKAVSALEKVERAKKIGVKGVVKEAVHKATAPKKGKRRGKR